MLQKFDFPFPNSPWVNMSLSRLLPFLSPPLVFLVAPARPSVCRVSSARPSVGAAPGDAGHQDRNAAARRRQADARIQW